MGGLRDLFGVRSAPTNVHSKIALEVNDYGLNCA